MSERHRMPNGTRRARHAAMPLLDLAHLSRQTAGDATLAADLLLLFQQQSRQVLGGLAKGDADLEGARDLAHRLKGAARTVGAARVAAAAEAVEIAAFTPRVGEDRFAHYLADLNVALVHTLGSIALVLRRGPLPFAGARG